MTTQYIEPAFYVLKSADIFPYDINIDDFMKQLYKKDKIDG